MSKILEDAAALRKLIETMANMVPDDRVEEFKLFYEEWNGDDVLLTAGTKVRYKDQIYKVLQTHRTQFDWTPDKVPALFGRVLVSEDPAVVTEWEQPDSTNPYSKGDKVLHGGKIWTSTVDGNVWEPGAYGWEVVD